jgi:hypothetical protein
MSTPQQYSCLEKSLNLWRRDGRVVFYQNTASTNSATPAQCCRGQDSNLQDQCCPAGVAYYCSASISACLQTSSLLSLVTTARALRFQRVLDRRVDCRRHGALAFQRPEQPDVLTPPLSRPRAQQLPGRPDPIARLRHAALTRHPSNTQLSSGCPNFGCSIATLLARSRACLTASRNLLIRASIRLRRAGSSADEKWVVCQ